jgi:hypothetical protein
MTLKLDAENYRDPRSAPPPGATQDAGGRPLGAPAAARVNWKIVRAVGLALLVWCLIAAVLLSL